MSTHYADPRHAAICSEGRHKKKTLSVTDWLTAPRETKREPRIHAPSRRLRVVLSPSDTASLVLCRLLSSCLPVLLFVCNCWNFSSLCCCSIFTLKTHFQSSLQNFHYQLVNPALEKLQDLVSPTVSVSTCPFARPLFRTLISSWHHCPFPKLPVFAAGPILSRSLCKPFSHSTVSQFLELRFLLFHHPHSQNSKEKLDLNLIVTYDISSPNPMWKLKKSPPPDQNMISRPDPFSFPTLFSAHFALDTSPPKRLPSLSFQADYSLFQTMLPHFFSEINSPFTPFPFRPSSLLTDCFFVSVILNFVPLFVPRLVAMFWRRIALVFGISGTPILVRSARYHWAEAEPELEIRAVSRAPWAFLNWNFW